MKHQEKSNNSNYIDTINHISDPYQAGVYVLAIEYVYLAIKKMIRNGVKSNDDAYIDLFDLQKKYWINGYSSDNYINDLIQLTYIDVLETIPQDAEIHNFIECFAKNVMQDSPTANYQLHIAFCKCYYSAQNNPLIKYQNKLVNRIRTYYRNKGDLVERCEPKTVNSVAIEHACNQLERQRVAELLEQKELINKINNVVEYCTKTQRQVFELKIKGYSYRQIAQKVNSTVSSCTNMYNKVVARVRSQVNLKDYTCDTNYSDAYMVGMQLIEDVID